MWYGSVDAIRQTTALLALKLLWSSADYLLVKRSVLVTGLSLAFSGMTLLGLGNWVTGHPDSGTADSNTTATITPLSYTRPNLRPSLATQPDLPEATDHLPSNNPGYTFRHDVPEVRLQFTVADEQGRLVRDLTPADLEVYDNDSAVQRFSDFERDDNLPLQLGLVLDTSDSVRRVLPQEKVAAVDFLDRVMRPQTDVAFVMAFGGDVKTWQNSTSNRQELVDAVDRLKEPGWGTRIFDALYSACSRDFGADDGRGLRRAVVVLTDGNDNDSLHTLRDVIAAAQRSETQIYALTIHWKKAVTRGDRVLRFLADSTGGRFYVANSGKDLNAVFAQIEQDLRTQYYLSFSPQHATPGFHSLRVEVRSPRKLEIHARQGYFALQQ
jgi:VWFA-related protein